MYEVFDDRESAGRRLAPEVERLGLAQPVILGLPRGGVPVAFEVAAALDTSLDVIVVRKLGAPYQPELALGAIASGGVLVLNEAVARSAMADEGYLDSIVERERAELERRERAYRDDRPFPGLEGRNVVLVDDGLATGATMQAAVEAVRSMSPGSVSVAVPVGSKSAVRKLTGIVDNMVCLEAPASFQAVGQFYRDFRQTTDEDVRDLLARAPRLSVACGDTRTT